MKKVLLSMVLGCLIGGISNLSLADAADDKILKDAAETALTNVGASADIKVLVKDNVITLEGTTLTKASADKAEATVRDAIKEEADKNPDIMGVTVKNHLNGIHD